MCLRTQLIRFKEKSGEDLWNVDSTRLSKYAKPLNFNVLDHILNLTDNARKQGNKFNLLEVGTGSGDYILSFLNFNKDAFSYKGTVLAKEKARPELRSYLTEVDAAHLEKVYKKSSFHMILSHFGGHGQWRALVKSAENLLKIGGELIISSQDLGGVNSKWVASNCPTFRDLPHELNPNSDLKDEEAMHLKKIA